MTDIVKARERLEAAVGDFPIGFTLVHAADLRTLLSSEAGLIAAVERLGSGEAFDVPQVIDGPLAEEVRQRMDYARSLHARACGRET